MHVGGGALARPTSDIACRRVTYWQHETVARIPPKPGSHDGGIRFMLRSRDRGETFVTVLRDEAGHGRRLTPTLALEGLADYLRQTDRPPEQVRQARDGSFYVPGD